MLILLARFRDHALSIWWKLRKTFGSLEDLRSSVGFGSSFGLCSERAACSSAVGTRDAGRDLWTGGCGEKREVLLRNRDTAYWLFGGVRQIKAGHMCQFGLWLDTRRYNKSIVQSRLFHIQDVTPR